jgi:hypothetical protein
MGGTAGDNAFDFDWSRCCGADYGDMLAAPANADRYCRKVCDAGSAAAPAWTEATASTCTIARTVVIGTTTITAGMAWMSKVPALALKWTAKNQKIKNWYRERGARPFIGPRASSCERSVDQTKPKL